MTRIVQAMCGTAFAAALSLALLTGCSPSPVISSPPKASISASQEQQEAAQIEQKLASMAKGLSTEHPWLGDVATMHLEHAQVLSQGYPFGAKPSVGPIEATEATLAQLAEQEKAAAKKYLDHVISDDSSVSLLYASLHTTASIVASALDNGNELDVNLKGSSPSILSPSDLGDAQAVLLDNQQDLVAGLEAMNGVSHNDSMATRLQQARRERDETLAKVTSPTPGPVTIEIEGLKDPARHKEIWAGLEKDVADSWALVLAASPSDQRKDAAKSMSGAYSKAVARGWQLTCWPGWR